MLDKKNYTFIIPEKEAEERLDQALAKLLPDYSRTQIKAWIDIGYVLVNGKVVKAKTKLKGKETIEMSIPAKEEIQWEAEPISLDIIYEDDDLMIINKPAGLVVHPGAGTTNQTLLNALIYYEPKLRQLPRAGIIHRIDKDTTGLLMIAKSPLAVKHLSQQLKKRTLVREYQAVIYGVLISGGKVDAPISRHPFKRTRMAVSETGKQALTHYRVAERFRAHTRLIVRLETGRTHQIRVHMAHIHHPIVGDITYGGRIQLTKGMSEDLIQTIRQFKRQALHAFALSFIHPKTNEHLRFEIELPEDLKKLVKSLRNDMKRK